MMRPPERLTVTHPVFNHTVDLDLLTLKTDSEKGSEPATPRKVCFPWTLTLGS